MFLMSAQTSSCWLSPGCCRFLLANSDGSEGPTALHREEDSVGCTASAESRAGKDISQPCPEDETWCAQRVLSAIIVAAVPLPTVGSVRMCVKERPRADAWLP